MHRLKYVTFLIVAKLTECSPSIIDLRIPKKEDQPTFKGESYIFLNDYMKRAHIKFCEGAIKEHEETVEVAGDLSSASRVIFIDYIIFLISQETPSRIPPLSIRVGCVRSGLFFKQGQLTLRYQ